MASLEEQKATQIKNIENASGKTVADFLKIVRDSGKQKHGEILNLFKSQYGLSHGNANAMAHVVRQELEGPTSDADLLGAQYAGAKAALRPIYDELAAIAESLGDDVEKVIQKTGVSFRRNKQFALVQAPSSKRVQLGLNFKEAPAGEGLVATGGMCTHRVDITDPDAVNDEVASWIRTAYEQC